MNWDRAMYLIELQAKENKMHTLIDTDGHAYWCACRLDFDHDHVGEKVDAPELGPTLRPV